MIQTISPNEDLVIDVVLTDRSGNVIEDSLIANLQFVVFTEETSELQRVYLSSSRYTDGKLYINSSELATLTSGQLYLTTAIALLNSQYNDGSFDYIKTNALPYYLRNNITSVTDDEAMLSWKIDVTKSLQDINATLKTINSRLLNVEAAAGDSSAITEMINTALEGYATIEYVDGQDSSIVNSIPDAVDLTPYATTDEVTAAIRAIPEPDLTPYATTADVSIALSGKADTTDIPDLEPYALKTSIPSIQGLATFDYVDQAVADVSVDLTGYATESYVDEHDASVANAIPSISGLATETFVTQQIGNIDLTPYATTADVSTALAGKADTADIPSLEGYATDASVAEAIAAIPSVDLTPYATTADVSVALAAKADVSDIPSLEGYATDASVAEAIASIPTVDLTPYATTADVSTALAGKADTADIPSLEGYATDASVAEAIAAIPTVDLTPYATTADVSTALGSKVDTTQLENVEYSVANAVNRLTERVENIETALLDDGSEDSSISE